MSLYSASRGVSIVEVLVFGKRYCHKSINNFVKETKTVEKKKSKDKNGSMKGLGF